MKGERIKQLRIKLGYSQKDLAKLLNVSHQTISKYEKGINIPDAEKLSQLSKIFNCTVDYLVGTSDTPLYVYESSDGCSIGLNKKIDEPPTVESVEKVIKLLIKYEFDKNKLIEDIKNGKIK